jgi:ABC-type Mn2+/Zn2+ transport system ATPase subunit
VHLAKLLKSGGNLLLLDEPTNDLDVETLRALEEAMLAFPGCVVVISHDRWFLDRIATHILAFEGDSQVTWFEGNYADYEADRHRRLGAARRSCLSSLRTYRAKKQPGPSSRARRPATRRHSCCRLAVTV